ncbi:metal-dependent hydrolase [Haloarchaeobius amylolyticus]|uniref:metal-dependent hydrolase n=1 Tax=Haloarchaeobius amylolyticus TaxID=1198296 RepID=UPI00226F75F4|nr:metal-dependent hydrolase [Haloarchaeobius amylolyticus]
MWPWEHLAFGYVCYSLAVRVTAGERPRGVAVAVVALATLLPDLVDKPLSWTLGVTATGYSVVHSLFVAPFLLAGVAALTRRLDRPHLFAAFAVGYLSHLLGDVIYPAMRGDGLWVHAVLWPVMEREGAPVDGVLTNASRYFLRFLHDLLTGGLSGFLLFELALVTAVTVLWAVDGFPVAAGLYRAVTGRGRE